MTGVQTCALPILPLAPPVSFCFGNVGGIGFSFFRLLGENRQGESASQKADGGGYGIDRREMIHVVYAIRGIFLPPFFWRIKNPVGILNAFSCRYGMIPKHGVDPAGTAIPYFLA